MKTIPCLLVLGSILCGAAKSQAQEAIDDLSSPKSAGDAWQALQKQIDQQKLDQAQTADLCAKFAFDHPKLEANTLGVAAEQACSDYGNVKDYAKQLDFSEAMWKRINNAYGLHFLTYSLNALINLDRSADVEKLVTENMDSISVHIEGEAGCFVMAQYFTALDNQGKQDEAIAQERKFLFQHPRFLDSTEEKISGFPSGRIYSQLMTDLIAAGQGDEGLGWAKLRFEECGFSEDAITAANDQLVRGWVAKTLSQESVKAFMAAQKDATAPNPLTDIKLPPLEEATKKALLGIASKGSAIKHDRVSAFIALGMLGEAMNMAKLSLVEQIGTPEGVTAGVSEVCRVFKAADLNVVRANDFVQFFQNGKGTNPIDDFMKQHPIGTNAPTP